LTFDELEELMQEPPGGENHGRVRTSGGWRSLEPQIDVDLPYVIDDPSYRHAGKYAHGTRSRYVHDRCRCDDCRRANREYAQRRRAATDAADSLREENL